MGKTITAFAWYCTQPSRIKHFFNIISANHHTHVPSVTTSLYTIHSMLMTNFSSHMMSLSHSTFLCIQSAKGPPVYTRILIPPFFL